MSSDSAHHAGFSGLRPGTVLDGKYEIVERLGAGGMGEVFKARHVHLSVFRCIKVMKPSLVTDAAFRTRFLREARLATQVHHPNIAVVHDFFAGDGGSYMVSEFIDGTTLRQWSAASGPAPVELVVDVASQVLAGLGHIHRRGLLHRDISPDNVMLSYDSDDRLVAKIIDLGIAKDVNTVSADTTQAGVLIGNPRYMSPEQLGLLGDDERLDGRTDIYSLGIVLYELLVGVPPFASETPHGYVMKRLTQTPAPFAEANPLLAIDPRLEQIVFRALERDRNRRYGDARELTAALAPFLTAPAGTLTRASHPFLDGPPDADVLQTMPALGPDDATIVEVPSTMAKAHAFELSLLDDVHARETAGDREALLRLAEAHPPGTLVGDGAREALRRLSEAHQRERHEQEIFQRAWEDGRASVWRAFIDAHPESSRTADARRHLGEALAFENAMSSDSETAMREFLAGWPEGRHHLEAEIRLIAIRQRLADEAFAAAKAAETGAAIDHFLARFPGSPHEKEARQIAAERLAFETAAGADSEEAWNAYLSKWSGAPRADDARIRRDHAHAREESQAFEAARNGGRDALQEFVRTYGDGPFAKKAKRLLRQLAETDAFAHAQSVDTPASWQLYLTIYPGGAHAGDARARLLALEEAAFSMAKASKHASSAEHFFAEFPDSARRDELALLVAEWEKAAAAEAAETARAAEPRDFDEAWETGTVAAWDRYLAAHTDSPRAAEARTCRQEAADFETAIAASSRAIWRAFLRTWPEGRHRIDAAVRLRGK